MGVHPIAMRPPRKRNRVRVARCMQEDNTHTEVVVVAADSLARARVAWKANDADGSASQANEDIEVLNDNPEQAPDLGSGRVRRLRDAVAALDGTRLARGGSHSGSSKSESGKDLELHVEDCEDGRASDFSEARRTFVGSFISGGFTYRPCKVQR